MRILACFAHPDDETILAGGLLALLAEANHEMHFLCCTRGEGGECGDPPICDQDDLGRVREEELLCAVRSLGGKSLSFLDYVDPKVGPDNTLYSFTEDNATLAKEIYEFVQKLKIDLIISHGTNGEYGHPAHLSVNQAVKMVVLQSENLNWYTAQAFYENSPKPHILNQDDFADWVVDVTSVLDKKIQAAYCHKSQHTLFVRKKSKELRRSVSIEDVIVAQEGYRFQSGQSDILINIPSIKSSSNLMNQ